MKVPSSRVPPTGPDAAQRPAGDGAGVRVPQPSLAAAAARAEAARLRTPERAEAKTTPKGESREADADPLWGGARKAARGTAETPGQRGLAGKAPAQTMTARDAFAAQAALARAAGSRQTRESLGAEVSQKPPPSRTKGEDPFSALNRAQPPGIYFKEDEDGGRGGGHDGAEAGGDPELEEAVEETLQLLFGVAGVHRVSPGKNDQGEPVVLIFATRGFINSSLERVPPQVRGFATLLVVPYELLPLRRL